MAIRINAGAAPVLGRITAPRGTFLNDPNPPFSQPSTAADGGLGAGGAMLPASQVPLQPGLYEFTGNFSPGRNVQGGGLPTDWGEFFKNIFNVSGQGRNVRGGGNGFEVPNALQPFGPNPGRNVTGGVQINPIDNRPSNAFKEPVKNQTNTLVGTNLSASPTGIANQQVKQMFPNLTDKQIQESMASRGYTYQFVGGQGGIWVKTGQGTGQVLPTSAAQAQASGGASGPLNERGRAEWVDPTQLQRGERVTTQGGFTFVGGTPTATGQAQYAVTIPGGVDDERYKWATSVAQDDEGNWVRTYKREKRAQYTRSWRKKQQQRAEEAAAEAPVQQQVQAPQSITVSPPIQFSQLVNLRADYG